MGPVLFRLALLAVGLAMGEVGLTSLAVGDGVWIVQVGLSMVLLVAGSAGFMGTLLGRPDVQGRGSDV